MGVDGGGLWRASSKRVLQNGIHSLLDCVYLLREPLVGLHHAPRAAVPDAGVEEVAIRVCVCVYV
jgi:hypothetical protein